jgi:DNA-binding transcriptional LysR family regulator
MDWDKLRIFHAVAEKGSLTHAGDVLHLSQSAVSRQIRALEESLAVTLFHRHARGLILTEQGELLFDATQADGAAAGCDGGADQGQRGRGLWRAAGHDDDGVRDAVAGPAAGALYEKYPALKIDLMLEERVLDLPMREADVAIRMKEPPGRSDPQAADEHPDAAVRDAGILGGTWHAGDDGRFQQPPADRAACRHAAGRGGGQSWWRN